MRSFTSQPAAEPDDDEEQASTEELVSFTFALDDDEFRCRLAADADDILGWSEFAAAALDQVDADSPEGIALTSQMFRLAMGGPEYRRFRRHLRAHHTKPLVLMDIIGMINEEMKVAVAKRTARPTGKPSSSSSGGTAQAERTAKVISLQDGDVTIMPAPADHLPPSSPSAKARKPKAGRGRPAVTGG